MNPFVMGTMLVLALSAFAYTMQHRVRLLLALRKENRFDHPFTRLGGMLKFAVGQRRMVQRPDTRAGTAHVLIFLGFLVVSLRTITLVGQGFSVGFHLPFLGSAEPLGVAYDFVKDFVALGVLFGCGVFFYRRLWSKPERSEPNLKGEALAILGMISWLMISDFGVEGARFLMGSVHPASVVGVGVEHLYAAAGFTAAGLGTRIALHFFFWTHVGTVLVFLNVLPIGKHFHVITALPNVFFKRLDAKARLPTLDLENEEDPHFGAATIADLHWKNLFDVYTCTECGRCLTHCPTYVTGKPLTHKGVNQALKHHAYELTKGLIGETDWVPGMPLVAAIEDGSLPQLNPGVIPDETAWACTTCGWCEQACPLFIEQVPRIVEMRRNLVMVESRFPAELTPFFKNLENQSNPWGVAAADRDAWCTDLEVPKVADGGEFEYLYYVGCAGSFDDRAKKIARSVVKVLEAAGVKFAILGREESCNGDQARRAGNEYLYQILAGQLIETLNGHGVKKIITTCPHCFNVLFNEYPDLGGHYEVIHHSSFIDALLRDGKLKLDPGKWTGGKVTYHDACYLGRHNGVFDAPRKALKRATGKAITEMPRNRAQGFCCGAGGSRMWMEEKLGTRINQNRVEEAKGTGAGIVATACPFCQTMMKDGISELGLEEDLKTFDLAEIVAETVAVPASQTKDS